MVGKIVSELLEELDIEIIYANITNIDLKEDLYKNISKKLYWTYNQELLNSIEEYKNSVDGIILLSTFPCGPDSLVNEMCERKINKKIITITMDEESSKVGLQTRIESFVDIIKKENLYD